MNSSSPSAWHSCSWLPISLTTSTQDHMTSVIVVTMVIPLSDVGFTPVLVMADCKQSCSTCVIDCGFFSTYQMC